MVEEAVILGAMSELEQYNSRTFCSITKTVSYRAEKIERKQTDKTNLFRLKSFLIMSFKN